MINAQQNKEIIVIKITYNTKIRSTTNEIKMVSEFKDITGIINAN